MVELFHVFSPTLVNEAKFGVNQDIYHTANVSPSPYSVTVSESQFLDRGIHHRRPGNHVLYVDDMTWVKARHIVKKFGVEIRRIQHESGKLGQRDADVSVAR